MSLIIARYKLFNANDASGNGLNGTANGGAYVSGKIGNAFDNEGDSKITVPYDVLLFQQLMTVSMWVNWQTLTYAAKAFLMSMYETTGNKRQWLLSTGTAIPYRFNVSSDGTSGYTTTYITSIMPLMGWHHFCVTVDNAAGTWTFYIDGALAETVTSTRTYTNRNAEMVIGGASFAARYPDALFDDVRVYNEVLPMSKIRSIWNFGKGSEECEPWQQLIQRTIQPTLSLTI